MLSCEYDNEDEKIAIHFDKTGAELLIKRIECLLKVDRDEHVHLFSKEWGGNELDIIKDDALEKNSIFVNHVKIYFWKEAPFDVI
jgi:hypothetical protein